ncbi:hypothetical protein MTO96_015309 [Rhipicephalus appendiculatus]
MIVFILSTRRSAASQAAFLLRCFLTVSHRRAIKARTTSTKEQPRPRSFYDTDGLTGYSYDVVPDIIHLVRYNQEVVSFNDVVFYRSMYLNHRPSKIMIHCSPCNLTGPYARWIEGIPFTFSAAVYPTEVFGRPINRVRSSVQRALDAIDALITFKGMRLSPEKTEAMLVHRSSVARYGISRFTLQGVAIPWKRRVTYLGVLLDHRLSWTPAIKAQCKSARRVASAARALLARGNGCSPTLALRLFNGMATARILYGLPLASISSNNWDKLEVVHRTAIRQYYSLPRTSQTVYKAVQDGTLERLTGDKFAPYRRRATAPASHREWFTLGSRVIIPSSARSHVLALLHAGRLGMVAMKCAMSYVWWPGTDRLIDETVRVCHECRSTQKSPPKAPIPTWDRLQTPWHTVHVDFAGPLLGCTCLVVVYAHTKWVEVPHVRQATSAAVIDVLRSLFATFGIPQKVVSDNVKAFISSEIKHFCASNAIQAATSPAYHPATHGQAKRYVAELKRALLREADKSIQCRLARFLYRQHTTIHTATGMAPAKTTFGRELLCPLDLLKRETNIQIPESQETLTKSRRFAVGERALIRQFLKKPDWIEGQILRRVGPRSWLVKSDHRKVRRHLNHTRKMSQTGQTTQSPTDWSAADDLLDTTPEEKPSSSAAQRPDMQDNTPSQPSTSTSQAVTTRQLRPPEVRRPPDRYGDFV